MAAKFTYTDTEVAEIVAAYQAKEPLEALAEKYSKSVASIRMKLVKLGVYVAKNATKSSSVHVKVPVVSDSPAFTMPTTKSGRISHYKDMLNYVGQAPF